MVHISVQVVNLIYNDIYYVDALAGQQRPASVTCSISQGIDAATIQWQLNGNTINVGNAKYKLISSTTLQIHNLVGSDEGTYSCSFLSHGLRYTRDLACIHILGKFTCMKLFYSISIIRGWVLTRCFQTYITSC